MTLEKVKLLYQSQDAVIKLFNDYFSIVSKVKHETTHGKVIPSMTSEQ